MVSKSCVLLLLLLLGVSLAANINRRFVEFDTPVRPPSVWRVIGLPSPSTTVRLVFAVKQNNLQRLEKVALAVSTPGSTQYGRFLNLDELDSLIRPNADRVAAILEFVSSVNPIVLDISSAEDFVVVEMSTRDAETLLQCSYRLYQHKSGMVLQRALRYSLPHEVADAVDFVGGVVRFPHIPDDAASSVRRARDGGVTPAVLRARYNLTDEYGGQASQNQQAVAAFLKQYYSSSDLQKFLQNFLPQGQQAVFKTVGPNEESRPGIEAELDIQYIMAMGAKIKTWFISTGGEYQTQEPFLEWILSIANTTDTPFVHSVSYGDIESSLSQDYMSRVNTEFMKAATRGLTILFASGDSGVGAECTRFVPNFPVSSPWVTGVGATDFVGQAPGPETVAGFSGGGFSDFFPMPAYQSDAVKQYLSTAHGLPAANLYSASGRAYPDVAALGVDFVIEYGGGSMPGVDGTSCSAPTFAGIVGLLNDRRLAAGKPQLGFLNPWLYQLGAQGSAALWDIQSGSNPGCGTNGFPASRGWDAASGWGTPNFPVLNQASMELD